MSEASTSTTRRFRIVAVADAETQKRLHAALFERRVFDVQLASSGGQAFALALATRADLVVLPERMADTSGTEACQQIRSHSAMRSVAVIGLLEEESVSSRERFQLAGAATTLGPRARSEELLAAIGAALHIPVRRPVRMTVLFSTERDGGPRESLGRAVNISQGGLALEVDRPYAIDTSVTLRFQLPGERRGIHCGARVRWSGPRGSEVFVLGLEFGELAPEQRDLLYGYLDRTLPVTSARAAT
jgi:CheY-like chemotaxis protein